MKAKPSESKETEFKEKFKLTLIIPEEETPHPIIQYLILRLCKKNNPQQLLSPSTDKIFTFTDQNGELILPEENNEKTLYGESTQCECTIL